MKVPHDVARPAIEVVTVGAVLLCYLTVSLSYLETVPPAYGDESWESSTAWKLATEGTFGSDMLAGFYGMEDRYYGFLPLHPFLLAATFRVFGLGLYQARLVSVAMGLLVLVLTHALGRRLFGWRVGALAITFLVAVRLAGATRLITTGIPLVDVSRIARYDIVVPVLGLAALHVYLWARDGLTGGRYLLAGLLAGLAGLAHLYGVFWLPALVLLALCDRAGSRNMVLLALGFALPWLPYLGYVLAHPGDWLGQTRLYAPRFELLNPSWYWANLIHEPRRYGPGLGPPSWTYLLRPGLWFTLALLPPSLWALTRRGLVAGDPAARAVALPTLVLGGLFALLLHEKLMNYAITIWPLAALAIAWGGTELWRRLGTGWIRAVVVIVVAAVAIEGAARIATLRARGAVATNYEQFLGGVRAHVPAEALVLGQHDWWLGLSDLDYHAWLPLLLQSTPGLWTPEVTVDHALGVLDPDVILIDSRMRAFLDGDPRGGAVDRWIRENDFLAAATVTDPTYGAMTIYRRER